MATLDSQKFDLAVVDGIHVTKCFYLVPHRLSIPWVTYTDAPDPLVMRAPWLPSFVPHLVLPLSDRMGFVDRLKNTLMLVASAIYSPFPDPPSKVIIIIISASLAIRIAEQSAYVTDHVVPRLSVRMYVLWRNG